MIRLLIIPIFYALIWFSYAIGIKIGIYPKKFVIENLFGICGSWLSHENLQHIESNSIVIFPVLLSICIIEKRALKILSVLIITSGLATWFLGSPNSFHLGASGLLMACYGYILSSLIFRRSLWYSIPLGLCVAYYGLNYFTAIVEDLIPHEGVSFAAHFGGIIAGFISGLALNKSRNN